MLRLRSLAVTGLLAGLLGVTPVALAGEGSGEDAIQAEELASMLGVKLTRKDRNQLRDALTDARPEVRALAAAMLFGHDPEVHERALADVFAVDHGAEDPGARVVTHGEIDERLHKLADARGGAVPKELEPLLVFLAYKDDPAFFDTPIGKTSVARFYRGAFLSLAWAEAEAKGRLDRMRVLQHLDRAVSAEDEADASSESASSGAESEASSAGG